MIHHLWRWSSYSAYLNRFLKFLYQNSAINYREPRIPGMVDDFQKKYDALKIPYPQDTYTSSIDSEASSLKADYAKFVDESKKRIVGIQQEQAKWEAMMPVEEMNLEEALDAGLTQYVVDVNKANEDDMTLWPHDETYGEYKKRLEQMRKENPELDAH